MKGGSVLNQEPFNEAAASALYSRLLAPDEYVKYRLESRAGGAVCICENFVGSTEEYIPSYYVRQTMRQPNHRNDYQHYLECCSALDAERVEIALSKMIVCDDILGNSDRHWRNFGLCETWKRCATVSRRCSIRAAASGARRRSKACERTILVHDQAVLRRRQPSASVGERLLVVRSGCARRVCRRAFGHPFDNPALVERVDYICCAVQKRIDRIVRML
ncbi:MAG: hypothetical protein ACLTMP_02055 [Eggerthella lenta]